MILHPIEYNQGLMWVDKTAVAPIDFSKLNYQENNGLVFNEENLKSFGAVYEIIAVSNLNLPNTPSIEIEEDINDLAYQYYTSSQYHNISSSYHWLNGYKAASAKKYTEEDLRKAFQAGTVVGFDSVSDESDPYKRVVYWHQKEDVYIQSIQHKPVSVEIEMKKGCGIIIKPCDCSEMDMDCQYLIDKPIIYTKDGKTFLKVKKINYE